MFQAEQEMNDKREKFTIFLQRFFSHLTSAPDLRHLKIVDEDYSEIDLVDLTKLPMLRTLNVRAQKLTIKWSESLSRISERRRNASIIKMSAPVLNCKYKKFIKKMFPVTQIEPEAGKRKPNSKVLRLHLKTSQECPEKLDSKLDEPLSIIVQDTVLDDILVPQPQTAYNRFLKCVQNK